MKLFSAYVLRNLPVAFVSLTTKVKSWPEMCIWPSLYICNAQGPWGNTKISLLIWVCLFGLSETFSAQPLPWMLSPRKPGWIPCSGSHPCSSPQPSLKPAGQGSSLLMASLHACGTAASFPFLLFNFPKCVCANTTGFLFQPDKKWLFLLQCVRFLWVRNCDLYIHFFIQVNVAVFLNRNISKSWRRLKTPSNHYCISHARFSLPGFYPSPLQSLSQVVTTPENTHQLCSFP